MGSDLERLTRCDKQQQFIPSSNHKSQDFDRNEQVRK